MPKPSGAAGRIEDEVLEQEQTALLAQSATMKKQVAKGGRRPLRVQPTHVSVSQDRGKYGDTLELKFDLPAGSYATVLLREVMKP